MKAKEVVTTTWQHLRKQVSQQGGPASRGLWSLPTWFVCDPQLGDLSAASSSWQLTQRRRKTTENVCKFWRQRQVSGATYPPNRRRDHLPHNRDGKSLFLCYSIVYKVLLLETDAHMLLEFYVSIIYPTNLDRAEKSEKTGKMEYSTGK